MLGSFTVGRGQYNDHDLTVRPSGDLSGVASQLAARLAARPVTVAPREVPAGETDRFDGTLRANDDGSFSVLRDGSWQSWPCPATQAGELRDLLGLRDTVAALLDAEASSPEDTPAITGLRAELNRRYDAYATAYGPVNRTGWKRTGKTDEEGHDVLARHRPPQGKFSEDPYAAAVYALEDFDPETGQAAKTVIFTKRVITTRQPPERASDPADAAAICLDRAGEIRLEDAARLLGSASAGEARTALGELVYDEPGTGRLVPAAEYLSGKVRAKLRDAEQAAGDDPRFEVNVAALRRALPPDLGPGEIDARLGASWIDPRYVQQGLREILEDPALMVEKGHGTAWTVTGSKTSVLATQVWGTEDKDAVSLAACLLEQRPVKVSPERSDRDDTAQDKHQKRLQAAAATVTARAKADELNRRFGEWLWEDTERTATWSAPTTSGSTAWYCAPTTAPSRRCRAWRRGSGNGSTRTSSPPSRGSSTSPPSCSPTTSGRARPPKWQWARWSCAASAWPPSPPSWSPTTCWSSSSASSSSSTPKPACWPPGTTT